MFQVDSSAACSFYLYHRLVYDGIFSIKSVGRLGTSAEDGQVNIEISVGIGIRALLLLFSQSNKA